MRAYYQKKLKTANILRFVLMGLLLLTIGFLLLLYFHVPLSAMVKVLYVFCAFFLFVGVTIAYARVYPYRGNYKWLKAKGCEDVLDDIDLSAPTFPRSKIYCGSKAMFSKKSGVAIPYGEILWAYKRENQYNGFTVRSRVVFRLRNGGTYEIKANDQEVNSLLAQYVLPASPDLIVGYDKERKQRYRELRSAAETSKKN